MNFVFQLKIVEAFTLSGELVASGWGNSLSYYEYEYDGNTYSYSYYDEPDVLQYVS